MQAGLEGIYVCKGQEGVLPRQSRNEGSPWEGERMLISFY